jgi:hypothetical protein
MNLCLFRLSQELWKALAQYGEEGAEKMEDDGEGEDQAAENDEAVSAERGEQGQGESVQKNDGEEEEEPEVEIGVCELVILQNWMKKKFEAMVKMEER